jgi:hypothetical protein
MTERRVSECKECGAQMRWVKTRKGKNMPIDDEPDSSGRFVVEDPDSDPLRVRFLGENEEYTGDRFTSHFQTCTNPRRFSKKGGDRGRSEG